VVDDVVESATTQAMVLQHLGQNATALHDGQTAIDWIQANHPEVVFLDVAMPKMDGYAVARRLREFPELHHTVLVALTGYGQPEDQQQALRSGFDYHLTKPIGMAALKDLLRKLPVESRVDEDEVAAV
jgi:CheY-like chemotaxis protein